MSKPLAIDLYSGLGGWAEGLLATGWSVVGFDIERHHYGDHKYPAQLVLQDVLTLHGSQFRNAALIVASPPCQAYSYRAMPWSRAKALPPPDNTLFDACFRIQREACEAAGRHIPLIVENVRGAQKWVGRSRWNYGSFYLWGDVPALMPPISRGFAKVGGLDWSKFGTPEYKAEAFNTTAEHRFRQISPAWRAKHYEDTAKMALNDGVKDFTPEGQPLGKNDGPRKHGSKSKARKAASAMIAKIPLPLSRWIARTYYPEGEQIRNGGAA